MTSTISERGIAICPRCKMEALRLLEDGTSCDWCVVRPGLGRPFNARAWNTIIASIERRKIDAETQPQPTERDGRAARKSTICRNGHDTTQVGVYRRTKNGRVYEVCAQCSRDSINRARAAAA